ncbi:hypothetical protein TNCV_677831 [Trichonephila clavipes]|nr:hypothetical protein TNCV_677831 [Trichonephila clavipes]
MAHLLSLLNSRSQQHHLWRSRVQFCDFRKLFSVLEDGKIVSRELRQVQNVWLLRRMQVADGGHREGIRQNAEQQLVPASRLHRASVLFVLLTNMMKIKDRNGDNDVALVHPGSMRNVSSMRVTLSIVMSVAYDIRTPH